MNALPPATVEIRRRKRDARQIPQKERGTDADAEGEKEMPLPVISFDTVMFMLRDDE